MLARPAPRRRLRGRDAAIGGELVGSKNDDCNGELGDRRRAACALQWRIFIYDDRGAGLSCLRWALMKDSLLPFRGRCSTTQC